jgi:hypothetical protein
LDRTKSQESYSAPLSGTQGGRAEGTGGEAGDDTGGSSRSAQLISGIEEEEDIFGKHATSSTRMGVAFELKQAHGVGQANGGDVTIPDPGSTGKGKRVKVPQQILDNKAVSQCRVCCGTTV